jgi:flagellar protein FliS
MAQTNALSAYRQTKIMTASQGQLIIMLYDGGIRNLDSALELFERNSGPKRDPSRIEEIGKAILKAQEIITELMVSLDFEQGGEVAKNLFALYTWFNKELLEAHASADAARITVVRNYLRDIRDSWSQIFAGNNAVQGRGSAMAGLNIAG